jgi:hypothetical protein
MTPHPVVFSQQSLGLLLWSRWNWQSPIQVFLGLKQKQTNLVFVLSNWKTQQIGRDSIWIAAGRGIVEALPVPVRLHVTLARYAAKEWQC